jgi:hypothetical protein
MATWNNQTKNLNEVIYFVMEDGSYYLVGADEDLVLVTQDEINWNNQTKNSGSWNNQSKN